MTTSHRRSRSRGGASSRQGDQQRGSRRITFGGTYTGKAKTEIQALPIFASFAPEELAPHFAANLGSVATMSAAVDRAYDSFLTGYAWAARIREAEGYELVLAEDELYLVDRPDVFALIHLVASAADLRFITVAFLDRFRDLLNWPDADPGDLTSFAWFSDVLFRACIRRATIAAFFPRADREQLDMASRFRPHEDAQLLEKTPDLSQWRTPAQRIDAYINMLTMDAHAGPATGGACDGSYYRTHGLTATVRDLDRSGYGSIFRHHPTAAEPKPFSDLGVCTGQTLVLNGMRGLGLALRERRDDVLTAVSGLRTAPGIPVTETSRPSADTVYQRIRTFCAALGSEQRDIDLS